MIGVLGGAGAVGRVVVDRLARGGIAPLRIGGRDADRARRVAQTVMTVPTEVAAVELDEQASLDRFCAGCDLVVNCAGPSYRVLDRVARAALHADAHYVETAGDSVAQSALEKEPPEAIGRRAAVFSAGLMPGLSGLLPRLLAADPPPSRLDSYVGGSARIGALSAVDALLTRGPDFGTPMAVWRDGAVVERALSPLREVTLPGFPGRVHAWPFLSTEAVHLAAALGVQELRSYTVYVSDQLTNALATAWADGAEAEAHAEAVVRASELDVATHGTHYTMLFFTRPRPGSGGRSRRMLLQTPDPYALSGVVAALTAEHVLGRRVPSGARLAADVLDPHDTLARLERDPLVTHVEVH